MSNWLSVSIWIIFAFWSLVEVHGLYVLGTNRFAYYTQSSCTVTYLWVLFSVFWLCFQFIGTSMKIYINKHPLGWLNNLEFALCQLIDGLIRTLSLGLLCSTLAIDQTRRASKKYLIKLKQRS